MSSQQHIWTNATIGEVATLSTGTTPPSKNAEYYENGDCDWFTPADIQDQGYLNSSTKKITQKAVADNKARIFEQNTILVTCIGNIGRFGLLNKKSSANQQITGIKINSDCEVNPEYLFYYLMAQKHEFTSRASQATLPIINQSKIREIPVRYPLLPEQNRLVREIKEMFSRIKEIRGLREIAIKESQALLGAVTEDIFREAGGNEVCLADVASIEGKLVDPREAAYKNMLHVGGANIVSETGELIEMMTAEEEKLISGKFVFNDKDVLYSKIRPYLKKVARPDFTGLCSADMYPLRPAKGRLHRDYLFFLLLSRDFTNYAIKVSNRAGMPKVNREQLFAYRFNLPSYQKQIDVIEKLNESMQAILAMVAEMKEAVSESDFIQQSILKKAFAGEL